MTLFKYSPGLVKPNWTDELSQFLAGDYPIVKKSRSLSYYNIPASFDIEVTSFYNDSNEKQATMYAWVFGLQGYAIRGRTWDEFHQLLLAITDYLELSTKKRLIVYVHNLSYEFQFLCRQFEWYKVFATDTRKPLYAITKSGIEFRCSYMLSGYNLETLAKNLTKYKLEKLVGDLDYNLPRHSKTPLTEKEWSYILHDGVVVMCYIQEEIERVGSIAQLPLTKTGYVRELCRNKCLKGEDRWDFIKIMQSLHLTPRDYQQLKCTYSGGFTHANYNYANQIIHNVHSYDFSSSYPSVMLSEQYPMSEPIPVEVHTMSEFNEYLHNFCCMFTVKFTNIRSTVSFENYISSSRCTTLEHSQCNNGRVVYAGTLVTHITEQDYFTIREMYDWDEMYIKDFYIFKKAYLPKPFVMAILEMYRDKTTLKGVEGKEVEYLVSKGMLNSAYGMCVTDICRDENTYENESWKHTKSNIEEQIAKYNKSRQRFLYYPWGVWVTAYARRNLFSGILEFRDDYVYSDTDSIKVVNIEKHQEYITNYNKQITKKVYACLDSYEIPHSMSCPKTIKGKSKPLGVWDYEGMYNRFKTLGAKRYMTETDGKLSITIAGVGKSAGVEYLEWLSKGNNTKAFELFTEGIEFPAYYEKDGKRLSGCGKLLHTYIDGVMAGELTDYLGNTARYAEDSGIYMENTEYTLSLESEYQKLLMGVALAHLC